jgi:glucosamine 6-phosphate synthetase-like amidotransferase/phosphosugar isomerase protein
MCGITAVSRAIEKSSIPNARTFMQKSLVAIESRGRHATGTAWFNPDDGDVWFWKEQGAASKVAKNLPIPKGVQTMIGHTRYGTIGPASVPANNHPLIGPGIGLVHNGRVENYETLFALSPHYARTAEVDSEAFLPLLLDLDAFGVDHVTDVLEMVKGVASIAWLDALDPGVLHMARLSTRPLTIGWTRRSDLIMSSTPATLAGTSLAAKVRIEGFQEIPEGTYLRVEGGKITDRRTFTVRHPSKAVPDDRPKSNGLYDGKIARRRIPNQNRKPHPYVPFDPSPNYYLRGHAVESFDPDSFDADLTLLELAEDSLMYDETMDFDQYVAEQMRSR